MKNNTKSPTLYLLIAFGQLLIAVGQLLIAVGQFFNLKSVDFKLDTHILNSIVFVASIVLLIFCLYKYFTLKKLEKSKS